MKRNIERFKNHCCGCGLCQNICPKSAISMKKNVQGFLYPAVDQSKCVECGLCVKSCVFQDTGSPGRNGINKPLAVAFKHKNAAVREQSQSGGAFTAISDLVLHNGGVVYGCELVDFCTALHTRAENREERNRQVYSKRSFRYLRGDSSRSAIGQAGTVFGYSVPGGGCEIFFSKCGYEQFTPCRSSLQRCWQPWPLGRLFGIHWQTTRRENYRGCFSEQDRFWLEPTRGNGLF